jgi:hypothetical protein
MECTFGQDQQGTENLETTPACRPRVTELQNQSEMDRKSIHGRWFEQANGIGSWWASLHLGKKNFYKTPNQKSHKWLSLFLSLMDVLSDFTSINFFICHTYLSRLIILDPGQGPNELKTSISMTYLIIMEGFLKLLLLSLLEWHIFLSEYPTQCCLVGDLSRIFAVPLLWGSFGPLS